MSVTPTDQLAGLLPAIISGGRPLLRQRYTWRLLASLAGVTADPVWVVRDDQAAAYEDDGREIAAYPVDWAEEYIAARWTVAEPMQPGGFLGPAPGREWACRLAEERGHWGVLMMDDNIRHLALMRGTAASRRVLARHGYTAVFADVLAAVALSTNAAMCGAHLQATNPHDEAGVFAREGFPYSLFVERCGEGREEWYGPCEDDILHAFQYSDNGTPSTAAVVVPLRYIKEHLSRSGNREWYNANVQRRSVGLQRIAPEGVRLSVQATHANGRGGPRVFHQMIPGAIRTPLAVHDHALYDRAAALVAGMLLGEVPAEHRRDVAEKIGKRARHGAAAEAVAGLLAGLPGKEPPKCPGSPRQ
jgi:hypothetical protein